MGLVELSFLGQAQAIVYLSTQESMNIIECDDKAEREREGLHPVFFIISESDWEGVLLRRYHVEGNWLIFDTQY